MSRRLQLQLQLQLLARAVRVGAVAPAVGASPRGLVVPARGVRVVVVRRQLRWGW